MHTTIDLSIPELAFIAATRGMAGAGIALLAADHVPTDRRRAVGWVLLTIGALTTIPIAIIAYSRHR